MGFNIGTRIIEDLLAKTGAGKCNDFREVAEMLAKVYCSVPFHIHSLI
jgi:hypothetical protein